MQMGFVNTPNNLNKYQDWLYTSRYRRIKNMSPIMFIGTKQNDNKGNNCEYHRKGNITGHIRSAGNQANQIIDQDKKENV